MCGIVGLFLKDRALEPELGALLSDMLITMSDRGPDSAGIAIYGNGNEKNGKLTLQSQTPETDFAGLADLVATALGSKAALETRDTHAVLTVLADQTAAARDIVFAHCPQIRVMSTGEAIEIYKEVGLPRDVANRFTVPKMTGTHGIGHTRMATESAVTTMGAHPFSTGADQCLVHNGSLSNHNSLRRTLIHEGVHFETENGFYTFVVGTKDGFGVLRDPIACKPAVMAETDQFVAFGSEYRALVNLPGIDTARVWEPEPATVYFWTH